MIVKQENLKKERENFGDESMFVNVCKSLDRKCEERKKNSVKKKERKSSENI
jgi:hypothetical protein